MKIIVYPSAPLTDTDWQDVASEKILSGAPRSTYKILYHNGEMYSGVYECTPGKWRVSYEEDEFCTLLEGHVRLTDVSGATQEFRAQENFMIPSGYEGTWEAVTNVRKCFVVVEKKK